VTTRDARQFQLLTSLIEQHAAIAGDVIQIAAHRWAIYGAIPVDGNVLVAEYDTVEEAQGVLRRLSPGPHRTGP
jgi:hypothetical protein